MKKTDGRYETDTDTTPTDTDTDTAPPRTTGATAAESASTTSGGRRRRARGQSKDQRSRVDDQIQICHPNSNLPHASSSTNPTQRLRNMGFGGRGYFDECDSDGFCEDNGDDDDDDYDDDDDDDNVDGDYKTSQTTHSAHNLSDASQALAFGFGALPADLSQHLIVDDEGMQMSAECLNDLRQKNENEMAENVENETPLAGWAFACLPQLAYSMTGYYDVAPLKGIIVAVHPQTTIHTPLHSNLVTIALHLYKLKTRPFPLAFRAIPPNARPPLSVAAAAAEAAQLQRNHLAFLVGTAHDDNEHLASLDLPRFFQHVEARAPGKHRHHSRKKHNAPCATTSFPSLTRPDADPSHLSFTHRLVKATSGCADTEGLGLAARALSFPSLTRPDADPSHLSFTHRLVKATSGCADTEGLGLAARALGAFPTSDGTHDK
jgi:hypothetical protein